MCLSSENQPRRNEEHEEKSEKYLRVLRFFVVDFHFCLQSNSISRQFSVGFNARNNRFSNHERVSGKRRTNHQSVRRKEGTLNLRARFYGWRTFNGGILVTVRHPSQSQ